MRILMIILAALLLTGCEDVAGYPDFYSSRPCPSGQQLSVTDRGVPVCVR